MLFEQSDGQQFPVRRPVAVQGLPVQAGHGLGDPEGKVVIASQPGHDRQFLAAAVQAEGAHEVAGEQGVQIMADELRGGRAAAQDVP